MACPKSVAFEYYGEDYCCRGSDYTIIFCPPANTFSTIKLGGPLRYNDQLISVGGRFTLGFFNENYAYLGIWYTNDIESRKVWVANPNKPNSGYNALSIDPDTGNSGMDVKHITQVSEFFGSFVRKCIFNILYVSIIPNHIAFIMDGNPRYSKKNNLMDGAGYRVGFSTLMSMLRYCYELGVNHITVYAFSIDNFKRNPEEVKSLMELMEERIEHLIKEEIIVGQYGVRVRFIGNLKLLSKSLRLAAEKAMDATAKNSRSVLSICVAYTSTDEILHAVQESCEEKGDKIEVLNESKHDKDMIDVLDIEKHMYMGAAPEPDIIIRTSGETRLSNFLLWQSTNCLLYSPSVLWPEIGFIHLVYAVFEFQKHFFYLDKQKKQREG